MYVFRVFKCLSKVDFDFFLALIFDRIPLRFSSQWTDLFFSYFVAPFNNVLNKPATAKCNRGKSFFLADVQ